MPEEAPSRVERQGHADGACLEPGLLGLQAVLVLAAAKCERDVVHGAVVCRERPSGCELNERSPEQ